MAVTYSVVITRAYIAARAIATVRMTTKVEASTIFICDSGRSPFAGLIGHSGNRIAVRNDMPQASGKRTRLRTEEPFRCRSFFSGMLHQLDDLTFCDTSNLIQVQTPLAFGFFQVNRR